MSSKYYVDICVYPGCCLELNSNSRDIRNYIDRFDPDSVSIFNNGPDDFSLIVKSFRSDDCHKVFYFDDSGAVIKTRCIFKVGR